MPSMLSSWNKAIIIIIIIIVVSHLFFLSIVFLIRQKKKICWISKNASVLGYQLSHVTRKSALRPMRTTKAQISLRIHAVWSAPLLFAAKISRLWFVSVAEQAGLSLTWSKSPKTGFLVTGLNNHNRKWDMFESFYNAEVHLSRLMTKPTKWHVRPAKTQISLGIRPVWSESSLSAWRKPGSLATHWAHSEESDQTGRMPRLIWVFAGRTCHFVGFVTRWLI